MKSMTIGGALRSLPLFAAFLLCPAGARGDKIVLKNGRQIMALSVSEVGDRPDK